MRWIVSFVALVFATEAFAAQAVTVSVSPSPAKACSNVNASFSGLFETQTELSLRLLNDKHAGVIYWQSEPVLVGPGSAAGTFQFRTSGDWPATNTQDGSVYKMWAYSGEN